MAFEGLDIYKKLQDDYNENVKKKEELLTGLVDKLSKLLDDAKEATNLTGGSPRYIEFSDDALGVWCASLPNSDCFLVFRPEETRDEQKAKSEDEDYVYSKLDHIYFAGTSCRFNTSDSLRVSGSGYFVKAIPLTSLGRFEEMSFTNKNGEKVPLIKALQDDWDAIQKSFYEEGQTYINKMIASLETETEKVKKKVKQMERD